MKIFLYALFLGFSAIAIAQGSLSGKITDDHNQPLAGVSVYFPDFHRSTTSDAEGRYTFTSVPSGTTKVIFSLIGYLENSQSILIDSQTTLNIILKQSVHEMDEVIVSTAFNKLQSQNVMKIEHATLKSLQQKGITSLAEGLATIPGVAQLSTGISIGKPVIRGLSGNRVLVYTQGVRLENQQFGGEHGLGLSDSGIESVEVIKGPASLLYGSDALGGVLYFNPEKFADANTIKSDFNQKLFSNTLGSQSSFGVKGSSEKWKFSTRAGYATHSDYKTGDGKRAENTRFNETDIKAAVGFSDQTISSVFRYNYNRLNTGLPEGEFGDSKNKQPDYPRQEVDNHIVSLKNNFFFSSSVLDADIGYIFNDRREFEDSENPALQMKLRTLNYDLKYHFPKNGNWETIAGIQGMVQTNANLGEEILIPDASVTDFGIYATSIFDWKSSSVQGGIRYDYRNVSSETHGIFGEDGYFEAVGKDFESFNASVGLRTKIGEFTLRANLASGFRAPNLAELTSNGVHEGSNRYEIGNANLQNEQNLQSDLNVEYKNSHFEFFVNGFYNAIQNYIYLAPTGTMIGENPAYQYVQDNAFLFGGEAGIHFHPHPLDWLHYESSFETVTAKDNDGNYLPLIPANSWENTIRGEFSIKNWLSDGFARINLSTTFAQKNTGMFESDTQGYYLLNLGIGGKIKIGKTAFDLLASCNNLFDKTYVSHLSRLKADGIPNIGRNVIFSVNFAL